MVVFFHSPLPAFQFAAGWAGVNLFFILSGFLITRILLVYKENNHAHYFRDFYVRRILRIFPLYFLYLVLAIFLLRLLSSTSSETFITQGVSDLERNWPYLFTYTYNFAGIVHFIQGIDYRNSVFFGHLWTLSVEEQFYFLFPLIVYSLPIRFVKKLLIALIVTVPFLRLLAVEYLRYKTNDLFWIGNVLYEFTAFQLDTLSLGCLLAMVDHKKILHYGNRLLLIVLAGLITIGCIHIYLFNRDHLQIPLTALGFDNPVFHLITPAKNWWLLNRYFYSVPLLNLFFALTLIFAVAANNWWAKILSAKLLVFIGKISYGIYIYHLAFSFLYELFCRKVFHTSFENMPLAWQFFYMAAYLVCLIFIAWLSYRFWETRWLSLRQKYFSRVNY